MDASLYVHFPWCLRKCPYCDFNSHATDRPDIPHDAYADAVCRELEARRADVAQRTLSSVFFGGGTPSLWDAKALGRVLRVAKDCFGAVVDGLEITVECNPTSLDANHVEALLEHGVNRLSIGVQSLDADRLRFLGRLHDADRALEALRVAAARMPRVSGDLIFGVPGLRAEDFVDELLRVVDTGVGHVSAYALTIEEGTQFGELARRGRLPIAPDEETARTFAAVESALVARGFGHYEVSNYARPGFECVHNVHTWRGGDYLGVGAGAVGMLSEGAGWRRWRSRSLPTQYIALAGGPETEEWSESVDAAMRSREWLMLGLRLAEGIDLARASRSLGTSLSLGREASIERAIARGDLWRAEGRIGVPRSRWLFLDGIVASLF